MDASEEQGFLATPRGRLAFRRVSGEEGRAGLVWLGGFHSDMTGEKATALAAAAAAAGRSFLRFDYSGHGASEGRFADLALSDWRTDALAALDELTAGPQLLVGSSMGGWIALLAALVRPQRVAGLVLVAPAADFTERLIWDRLDPAARRQIEVDGAWLRPSAYGQEPYPITRRLIEDGRSWLLLDAPAIAIDRPVRILQGAADPDVPWRHALELVDRIASPDVTFTLVKDGDHRLSRPQDIGRLTVVALDLADQVDAARA